MTENLTSPDNLPPDGSPAPCERMLLTHLLIVRDVDRSRAFSRDVLGAGAVQGQPGIAEGECVPPRVDRVRIGATESRGSSGSA